MLFNSLDFLVFFPIVTLVYFLLPNRIRWVHLLIASCIFYMFFIPAYILILLFTVTVDYIAGISIEKSKGGRRMLFLVISLLANLGVLFFFKYGEFFVKQANWLLHAAGSTYVAPWWKIILPIGLSFHTFQAMSYTIEVYRGNYKAERHFGRYALYVLFYPQLAAGPIERPSGLLDQLKEVHVFSLTDLGIGLRLMLWGFFKKLVIADRVGEYVDYVYGNAHHLGSIYILLAVLLFTFQIYCDFSGYSDIAIGAARTMGFRLRTNFNRPYFASDIREFWNRWHISLTSWFRDYLYIPLGGNRRGRLITYRNVFIVFLLSGFWHGADWNFIIWGAIHGIAMIAWMYYSKHWKKRGPAGSWTKILSVGATFLWVSFAFVFFRCRESAQAMAILSRLWGSKGDIHFNQNVNRSQLVLALFFILVMMVTESRTKPGMEELQRRFWPDVVFCVMSLTAILLFGVFTSAPFIYFQF